MKKIYSLLVVISLVVLFPHTVYADCSLDVDTFKEDIARFLPGCLLLFGLAFFWIFNKKFFAKGLFVTVLITAGVLSYLMPELLFYVSKEGKFVKTAGCKERGGRVVYHNFGGKHFDMWCKWSCQVQTTDKGNTCSDSAECQGACEAEISQCEIGKACLGNCSEWNPTENPCGKLLVEEGIAIDNIECLYA